MIAATLPMPPSVNHYYRAALGRRKGPVFISPEGRRYKAKVRLLLAGLPPMTSNLFIHARFYRARASGDLDNRLKALLDSLKGTVFIDDKQITGIVALRFDDPDNPRVEIAVGPPEAFINLRAPLIDADAAARYDDFGRASAEPRVSSRPRRRVRKSRAVGAGRLDDLPGNTPTERRAATTP